MMKLVPTLIHLDPNKTKALKRLAARISTAESRRVTFSELVRRAIREYLERAQPEGRK